MSTLKGYKANPKTLSGIVDVVADTAQVGGVGIQGGQIDGLTSLVCDTITANTIIANTQSFISQSVQDLIVENSANVDCDLFVSGNTTISKRLTADTIMSSGEVVLSGGLIQTHPNGNNVILYNCENFLLSLDEGYFTPFGVGRTYAEFQVPLTTSANVSIYNDLIVDGSVVGSTGSFTSLSSSNGVITNLSTTSMTGTYIYGATGTFTNLSATNAVIQNLSTTSIYGPTGSFDYLTANTFYCSNNAMVGNVLQVYPSSNRVYVGGDFRARGDTTLDGNTVVHGLLTNDYHRIALGANSGLTNQANCSVAIGCEAGVSNQQEYCVAIGIQAGQTNQRTNSIAIGNQAGMTSQNAYSVAIGYWAGQDNQGFNTVAVGTLSGTVLQGENATAVGVLAGYQYQGGDSVALGTFAGSNRQGDGCIGLGFAAGGNDQGDRSVSIGWRCGNEGQGASSVAVGNECGRYYQGANSVAVGYNCGFTGMGDSSVGVGYKCGANTQGPQSVALGFECGTNYQGTQSVAAGYRCGANTQGSGSVAVGYKCGEENQSNDAVAVGGEAGQYNQGHGCVAIGEFCGQYYQTANSVAVGHECGRYNQADQCVALGYLCGATGQAFGSTAIGYECGRLNQQSNCVAVGAQAGETAQGSGSVCIGNAAGQTSCGKNAIHIGKKAGQTNSHDSTIVLNAHLSNALNTDGASRFYVQPIRNADANGCLAYNATSKEITYSANASLTSLTSNTASFSGNVSISGLTIQPNTKENTALSGTFQVGNMRTETLFPNTAWVNNTPTGISLFNNRGSTDIYKAYGTYNGYYDSMTYYANTGLPTGSANSWTIENGDTYVGEHVTFYYSAYTPLRPYSSVYFYNHSSAQSRLIKSFVILGCFPSVNTYVFVANITIANPVEGYCHYSFPTIANAEGMAFIVTSITSGAQASASFRLSKLNFGYTDPPTQTIYIPQQLEVGNSAFDATANTSYDFICSGSSRFVGGVSFGDLNAWFPECRIRNANVGTGYFILPGGLCIQWSTDGTGTWTYQRPMDYVYTCQITRYGTGYASGYGLKINTLTATYVAYDSNYGSNDKYTCYCLVIGKINQ